MKLIHKVFLAMIIIFLIPTISIALQSLHCTTEAVYDLQKDALYSQAIRVNQEINSWVAERVKDLKLWQEHKSLLTNLAPEFQNHTHWRQDSSYEALLLFDTNGKLIQKFGEGHKNFLILDEKVRQKLKKTSFAVLENAHNHSDNHYSIHLGVATKDSNNKITFSVVVLNITQAFRTIFSIHSDSYPYAISILTDHKTDVLGGSQNLSDEDMNWFFSNGNQIRDFIQNNQSERIALSQPTIIQPWVVLISADKEKTFSWVEVLKERIGFTALMSVLVVLLLGAILSWGISRPFHAIIEYSKSISLGKINKIHNAGNDKEAQVVISAIDEMLDTIKKKNIEIQNKTTLATVGELTSSVVHEFRNPLSSVKMNLQAIKGFLKNEQTYSELTEIAFEQTLKLEKMLSELLTYGKPVTLNAEDVPVKILIDEWETQSVALTQSNEIKIEFSVANDVTSLYLDKSKMTSVLMNLIENASIALNGTGNVSVDIRNNELKTKSLISVRDTGPGIPENLLGELFFPFVTSRDEGTGLGLAIVMKFVKLHGGNIEVRNHDDAGAVFTISLPMNTDEK